MVRRLTVCLFLLGTYFGIGVHAACEEIAHSDLNISLPSLKNQFTANIIITFPNRSMSEHLVEYYDSVNNKAAIYETYESKLNISIYHFKEGKVFRIADGTCNSVDIDTTQSQFFQLSSTDGSDASVTSLMTFGANNSNTVYSGTDVVRGVSADHWTACVGNGSSSYSAHFYFATSYAHMPGSVPDQGRTPLRIRLNNAENLAFEVIYDFVLYQAGPIPSSVFEIPHGYLCVESDANHQMPSLDGAFTAHMEWVHPDTSQIGNTFCAFDYNRQLSRHDMVPSDTMETSYREEFGNRRISIIHDFGTGTEYVIDKESSNCSIRRIPDSSASLDYTSTNGINVIKHSQEIFNLGSPVHQGQRKWRGLTTDVFTRQDNSGDTLITLEAFFNMNENQSQFMGVWVSSKEKDSVDLTTEYIMNVYDYRAHNPDHRTFDLTPCYDYYQDNEHAMFSLDGSYHDLVYGKLDSILPVIWKVVAEKANVTQLRIADVYFDTSVPEYTDVWFTLLHPLPENAVKSSSGLSVKDAIQALKSAVDAGFSINVTYPIGDKTVKAVAGSLISNRQALDPRKPASTYYKVPPQGHSNGSMAGLGIGMLLLGLVGGAIGIVMWQRYRGRRHGVPYSRDIDDY